MPARFAEPAAGSWQRLDNWTRACPMEWDLSTFALVSYQSRPALAGHNPTARTSTGSMENPCVHCGTGEGERHENEETDRERSRTSRAAFHEDRKQASSRMFRLWTLAQNLRRPKSLFRQPIREGQRFGIAGRMELAADVS